MTERETPLRVRVWGDFACFTRPEMKVERVTYPVMTPSAARGVLEAMFWKPEFRWQIEAIRVLAPIRYVSIVRNEVTTRQSDRVAGRWHREGGGFSATADRAQRHTLALRDVAYIIQAQIALRPHVDADPARYRDQFRRRVQQGRCFATPYLGCREFAASFAPSDGQEQPIDVTDDLGAMLYDLEYAADGSGRGTPRFFPARLTRGVLHVPRVLHQEGP
jgi:CRISPR-associated protein Cas5d